MDNYQAFIAGFLSQFESYGSTIIPVISLLVVLLFVCVILYLTRKLLIFKNTLRQQKVFLELTPPASTEKTAYTTQQFFSVLHHLGDQRSWKEKLLGKKVVFSFEIVSTKEQGIRYLVQTTKDEVETVKKVIRSYLPFIRVKQVEDYLSVKPETKITEFALTKHFALPLAKQNILTQHDPVAYITGMMTKLQPDELVAFQVVLAPTTNSETLTISKRILNNEDVLNQLASLNLPWYIRGISLVITSLLEAVLVFLREITDIFLAPSKTHQQRSSQPMQTNHQRPARVLSTFEQEVVSSIQAKVNQLLFETTIRAVVQVKKSDDATQRIKGIKSALASFSVPKYQSLQAKKNFPFKIKDKVRLFTYKNRLLSFFNNQSSSLLSTSEIADLYHFPYTETTKTENIVKVHSKKLPAPLSLKQGRKLAVIFGENNYGGSSTSIGLTKEERETHMYLIGRTGSGKTTLMFSMSKADIENRQGMAFIDPHGDISEDLLASIPEERKDDVIYLNPIDLKYPIGINLLELTPGLHEDEAELEKEVVCEGVITLFRKVFSKDENTNAHRIEYILRNTIYTAFTVQGATLFTVYDLLNNPPFQKKVVSNLQDENLKNFWKFEFGRAGDYQVVKMVGGVTAKIGRFLFSPTAKRILEQKRSTINFDDIMNEGKILLCNFSQGNLGEDTARLLGTTILTKIQQAALRRARLPKVKRKPFYLYVDEFQNFATLSFIKMLSEGRKYGLSVAIAEQSTSQQDDRNLVNTILANVTTVVCFRSANPVDEQLMLTQFSPYVEKGDIANLPRYDFYIKISALEPEEPFSGKTLYAPIEKDEEKIERLIQASRKNYASVYTRKIPSQQALTVTKQSEKPKETTKTKQEVTTAIGLPKKRQ